VSSILDNRHDIFSLAGDGRQAQLTFPPDLTADEADEVCQWLFLVGRKLKRAAEAGRGTVFAAKLSEGDAEALAAELAKRPVRRGEWKALPDGVTTIPDPTEDDAPSGIEPPAAIPAVPEPQPDPDAEPEPQPEPPQPMAEAPVAKGEPDRPQREARDKRLRIARYLANGPQSSTQIANALDIPVMTLVSRGGLLGCDWFEMIGRGGATKRGLTDAGRQALREEGYIVPTAAEAEAHRAETSPPEPATNPGDPATTGPIPETVAETGPPPEPPARPRPANAGRFDAVPSEKAQRARAQACLIAETLADSPVPMTAEAIARESGLPPEAVDKRLKKHGPDAFNQSVLRYFLKQGDLWSLTDAGKELAKQAAGVSA